MGANYSKSGGANLPPEIFGKIGQYADVDTRTRMRRTGRHGFMVPVTYGPQIEEFLRQHLVNYLLENDTLANRHLFEKIILKLKTEPDDDDHIWSCVELNEDIHEQVQDHVINMDTFEKYQETIRWIYTTIDKLCDMKTYLTDRVRFYGPEIDTWFLKAIFGLDIIGRKRKYISEVVSNKRPRRFSDDESENETDDDGSDIDSSVW